MPGKITTGVVFICMMAAVPALSQIPHFTEMGPEIGAGTILNSHGSGILDFDNDGFFDIFVVQNYSVFPDDHRYHALLKNDQDGTFTNVTIAAGFRESESSAQGFAAADYDNDGDVDVSIAMNYIYATTLHRNTGHGTFTDVSAASGVRRNNLGRTLSFLDYNSDGYVDLLVMGASETYPYMYLFRNNGNGTFEDVARTVGLGTVRSYDDIYGYAVGDIDNDGDPDIFAANYRTQSVFYWNDNGFFRDATTARGLPKDSLYMGAVFLDYDNDGYLDLFLRKRPNIRAQMFRNLRNGMFANESSTLNVSPQYFDTAPYGGGLSTGDFNNDGFIDILILVKRPALNWLYLNDGDGTFTARNTVCNINDYQEYWSAPLADFNGDGYLDIYFCRNDAPPDQEFGTALYMNDGGTHHWLQFNLEGVESNRSAIGARVTVYTGNRKQMRHVTGGDGYKTDSFTVEFGLGTYTLADSVEIYWPSDIVQKLISVPADTLVDVQEQEGTFYFGSFAVSGSVQYHDQQNMIPNVDLVMTGQVTGTVSTNAAGLYRFEDIDGLKNFQVTPGKPVGEDVPAGAVSALDASLVARHSLGFLSLSGYDLTCADVDANGSVEILDAAFIARFAVGIPNSARDHAGNWRFSPASRSYVQIRNDYTNQNYTGYLLGDVNHDWANPSSPPKGGAAVCHPPAEMTVPETQEITVPLFLEKGTDLLSADVWIRYDTSCVEHTSVSRTALTSEFRLVWHAAGGLLKIALYGTREVNNRGSILDIGFRMKADAAGSGSLKWEVIRVNDQPFTSHMTTLVLDPAGAHTSSPLRFGLLDSYPNPFNPSTRIRYELDGSGLVSIAVFDIMGRHVRTLKHAEENAGAYEVLWDGKDSGGREVTSGMYIVQLVRGRDTDSIRILKAK